jgi:protein-S-isoprenylcysteine O-methyltransferase Ste14
VGDLVSGGLYRISRNPTFLGQGLLLGGIALAIPSVPTLLAVCLFFASASLQIQTEERLLVEAHGGRYRDYMARVPRWIGVDRPGCSMIGLFATGSRVIQAVVRRSPAA